MDLFRVNYYMVTLEISNPHLIHTLPSTALPEDWNHFPHQEHTQKIGDDFILTEKYLALKVPSATIQGEHNFLLNPNHPGMKYVSVIHTEPFTFDKRLFIR